MTRTFASIAEARAFYLKRGWVTTAEGTESYTMSLLGEHGDKIGEVMINREGFLNVVAEERT